LRIVVRIGILTIIVDIALGKVAALDTYPGGVVVLVQETIDHGDILPAGVGRELDLAGCKQQEYRYEIEQFSHINVCLFPMMNGWLR
jgi:hypothetical protein